VVTGAEVEEDKLYKLSCLAERERERKRKRKRKRKLGWK
jgi:hypothetical protein